MPMESVQNHVITQFSDMMDIKHQQSQSRLRPYVKAIEMRGEDYAYDGLGQVEARELQGRFNLTQFDDLEHFRRQLTKRQFSVTLPIDAYDVESKLTDPQGEYAAACVRAMERAYDRVVYDALFADVKTGRSFGTTVTASADGVLTVNATAGLTLAKLLEIKRNFLDNEVGVDEDVPIVFAISGDEHSTLLQIDQLVNSRYTGQLRLENGRIKTGMGMDILTFGAAIANPLLSVAAGVRSCFAMVRDGIAVGMARNWTIEVDRRPDYVKVTQVQITGVFGAVRTLGPRVQKVTTTDA